MSQASWSGPEGAWVAHPRPLAQQALKRARRAGWYVKKSSGAAHVWGVITCGDPELPREQRCSLSVLSTSGAADGSHTAQVIDDALRKCTHDRGTPGRHLLAEARALVESAAKCLEAAQSLQEADGHRELVEDFLNQTLEDADEADELMENALEEELAAELAASAAGEAAAGAGVPVTLGAEQLAVRADSRATEARQLIAGETDRDARMLRSRCDDIRQQAQLLLSRM